MNNSMDLYVIAAIICFALDAPKCAIVALCFAGVNWIWGIFLGVIQFKKNIRCEK